MSESALAEDMKTYEENRVSQLISGNKELIYPAMFYLAGLLLGVSFYTQSGTGFKSLLQGAIANSPEGLQRTLTNQFGVYFTLFSLTVLLGMCLIGFPFIQLIPLGCGLEIGLKLAYFYTTYSIKGIGYSLLMIIPETAAFMTVIIFTIHLSRQLSKQIYALTTQKTDMTEAVDLKSYLKGFFLYGVVVAVISVTNALAIFLMQSIVTI